MAYVLAALGGALGALARWGTAQALPPDGGWPWATLLVNLTGCLLIGVLSGALANRSPEPAWARPFLGVGVLGGYTTFSTAAVDVLRADPATALIYLAATLVGAVLAVWLGTTVTEAVTRG